MGRRRDSHRRPQPELEFGELLELAGIWWVYEDDAYCELYEQHREQVWDFRAKHPGCRPMGYWMLEVPDDAPHPADHEDEDGRFDLHGFDRAGIRWLAANDLLEPWEIEKLLNGAKVPDLTPHAREEAELDADATLDGLAERDKRQEGGRDGRRAATASAH